MRYGILSIAYPETLGGPDAQPNRPDDWMTPFYHWSEPSLGHLLTGVDVARGRQEIISRLGRINPSFLKPRASAANGLTEVSTFNVYGGHTYLVVAREAKP